MTSSLAYKNVIRRIQSSVNRSLGDQKAVDFISLNNRLNVNTGILIRDTQRISRDLASTINKVVIPTCTRCGSSDIYVTAEFTTRIKIFYRCDDDKGRYVFKMDTYKCYLKMLCKHCAKVYEYNWWNDISDLWTRLQYHNTYGIRKDSIDDIVNSQYSNNVTMLGERTVYTMMRLFPAEPDFSNELSSIIKTLESLAKGGQK